jgi:hypothetical protein
LLLLFINPHQWGWGAKRKTARREPGGLVASVAGVRVGLGVELVSKLLVDFERHDHDGGWFFLMNMSGGKPGLQIVVDTDEV